ncbi:CoA pyrophosphatase [Rhodoferax sp. AJA081-3]|uniref:CoA pyrophosphatase n=1 Tax=Rhodoferax sp. AJA081-3 TaxID=2752316 RepID=UPI001AE0E1EE|nr:CoA pyrophosphatase [Rhodoferax sp. AJA081-3]QTN29723.1 CoA pyrophosphatase [Rhodoferax sp. AJA081-3]
MTTPPSSPPLNFDPRQVPVVGVDAQLPKVPAQALQAQDLVRRFASAHAWTPELLAEPRFSQRAPVHASVLMPLVMRDSGLTVLLTERTTHLSSHSGQVAFPGGKADPEDADAIDTALREAEEEIGLERRFVQVLGTLPIYTTGSAFLVTPVVALVDAAHSVTANPHEVADVFEVPLDFLMDPANHRRHAVDWAGSRREWLSMPYTDATAERFIWGATAGMLRNFYRFLLF